MMSQSLNRQQRNLNHHYIQNYLMNFRNHLMLLRHYILNRPMHYATPPP